MGIQLTIRIALNKTLFFAAPRDPELQIANPFIQCLP